MRRASRTPLSMTSWNTLALILLSLTCLGVSEELTGDNIGSITVGSQKLVLALSADKERVAVSIPRANKTTELSETEWSKFDQLVRKAVRRAPRLKPNEAEYIGRVGEMHVGVTYDESGRYRGQRVAIYVVIERKSSGVNVKKKQWKTLVQLFEKTNLAFMKTEG